jgi:outer membrane lipoprotein SlyB
MKNILPSIRGKTAALAAVAGIALSQAGVAAAADYGLNSYQYNNAFQAHVIKIQNVTMHEDSYIAKSIGAVVGGAFGAGVIKGNSTASKIGATAMAGVGAYAGAQIANSIANNINPTRMIEVTMRDQRGNIGVALIPLQAAQSLSQCTLGSVATVVNTPKGPKILGCDPPGSNMGAAFGSVGRTNSQNAAELVRIARYNMLKPGY